MGLKSYRNAIDEFNKSIALNPKNPEPYYYLIQLYMKQNQISNAERRLKNALSMKLKDPTPFKVLKGDIHFEKGKYQKAIKVYRSILTHAKWKKYIETQIKRAEARIEKERREKEGF